MLLIALPPISFKITKRVCLGLQHHDEALLHHGVETGIIRRLPSGAYIEVEEPLPAKKAETLAKQIGYHGHDDHHELPAGKNGHKAEPTSPHGQTITRPVGVAAKLRGKLEDFWDEPRETVPDTQPHPHE